MRRGFLLNKSLGTAESEEQGAPPVARPKSKNTNAVSIKSRQIGEPRRDARAARIPIPTVHISSTSHEPTLSTLTRHTQVTLHVLHLPPPSVTNPGASEHITTCILLSGQASHILATEGFPRVPARPPSPCPYDLRPVPLSPTAQSRTSSEPGLGLFATAALETGDLVLSERPLLLTLRALPAGDTPGTRADDILECAVAEMPAREQRAFLALQNCKAGDPQYSRARGIVDTNAIGIGTLPGYAGDCAVVCELTCRANHSCSPNAFPRWDLPSCSVGLRARKPIRAGEEITISYLPELTLPRSERIDHLHASYAFTCACPVCSLTGSARTRSDSRRAVIARHRSVGFNDAQFADWLREDAGEAGAEKAVATCAAVMQMIDEEGCVEDVVWPVYLHWLCKAYCALGREEEARACARRAAGLSRAFTGIDGGWTVVADDPRMTEWWRYR